MNFTESKKDSFKSNPSEQINLFMSRWHKKKKKPTLNISNCNGRQEADACEAVIVTVPMHLSQTTGELCRAPKQGCGKAQPISTTISQEQRQNNKNILKNWGD